jgi:cytoskeletal protein CcmA (bactofilin family)
MDGNGEGVVPASDTTDDEAPRPPRMSFASRGGRPPAKAFVSKPFTARALASKAPPTTLFDRLHGQGPLVKWPAGKPGRTRSLPSIKHTAAEPTAAITTRVSPVPTVARLAPVAREVTAVRAAPIASGTPIASAAPIASETKEKTMSERFIAERLLSDRGAAYNPQIPRRVPDIPSPAAMKASEADSEGKRLVLGRQVQVSGEISGCERLIVEGRAQATLAGVKTLEVGMQGFFSGTAAVENAVIAGNFEGTLKVSGHLDIGAAAVVKGSISYGTIAIAAGGKLLGTIEEMPATVASE